MANGNDGIWTMVAGIGGAVFGGGWLWQRQNQAWAAITKASETVHELSLLVAKIETREELHHTEVKERLEILTREIREGKK